MAAPLTGGSTGPTVAETHSAIVFFVGDRAYKLKKPLDLGFLDFRTREARRAVCRREVVLNRRLAPDVYLGVADVVGVDGQPCDHLVVMRRMPDDRRLSALVAEGAAVEEPLRQVAHLIAALHAGSPRTSAADRAAGVEATRHRWDANTELLRAMMGDGSDGALVDRVHGLANRYLAGRAPLFAQRIHTGRAVDGHGDLLADDIFCLEDGPRILDCLEFDDQLRMGDGLADAAFLAMDLEHLHRRDLADLFLAVYGAAAADSWPPSLADHYIAYRAQVRAKVNAIRAGQGDATAEGRARCLLQQAAARLEDGRVRLVVVGGLPGTGKSTLAAGLNRVLGWTVLRSDVVRKELAGDRRGGPTQAPSGQDLYSEEMTGRTYRALLRRAETALTGGYQVVLDASWTDRTWRVLARVVAARAQADLVELRCDAPAALAAARLERRAAEGTDPSDATPFVAAAMAAAESPWTEAAAIDTTQDEGASLAQALAVVRPTPASGLTGL